MTFKILSGAMSTFGGPADQGVSETEGLALCEESEIPMFPETMFLSEQEAGAPGLARRLNPESRYVAARWNYDETPRSWLQDVVCIVTNPDNGKSESARPIDWGPNEQTGRICDLSPGLASDLELSTDDLCQVKVPLPPTYEVEHYGRICISSGHGTKIAGAAGPQPWGLVEVPEAIKVMEQLAVELRKTRVEVLTFTDGSSTTQDQNLKTICDWHNAQQRDLDLSIHFNAYQVTTTKPMGTECWYITQSTLANQISSAIAACGFVNRGAKKSTGLYFLNHTKMPACLLEICFVDSKPDCDLYRGQFEALCKNVAKVLSGAPQLKSKTKKRK